MVVICPKCRARLKIQDDKITPQGTRFKCPKCQAVLLVKRPAQPGQSAPKPPAFPKTPEPAPKPQPQSAPLEPKKVMVAHGEEAVVEKIKDILVKNGYHALSAADGVQAMVDTMKERPFLLLVDVALPRIYGFEVVKRLKARPETGGIKAILLSSIYDKRRYRREPASLYDADDYLDEHEIEGLLMEKVRALAPKSGPEAAKPEAAFNPHPAAAPAEATEPQGMPPARPRAVPASSGFGEKAEPPEAQDEVRHERPAAAPEPPSATPDAPKATPESDQMVVKAKRLARTIVADINLYSPEKVDNAVRNGNFYAAFGMELKEGKKLYDMRIPQDVRQMGDFFKQAIEDFIENKKKTLGV